MKLRDIAVSDACTRLGRGEKMLAAAVGTYQCRAPGRAGVRNGVLLATDRRVAFFAKRRGGYDIDTYRYDEITAISARKSLLGRVVTLMVGADEVRITGIRGDIDPLVAAVARRLPPT